MEYQKPAFPQLFEEIYYKPQKENPSYGLEMPQEFPYDPGFVGNMFDLGYLPTKGSSIFFLVLIFALFVALSVIFFRKFKSLKHFLSLTLYLSLILVFFGPLRIPSLLSISSTLGLAKLLAVILLLISLIRSVYTKKFDFFFCRSFLPLSFYLISLLISIFFVSNINFFISDLDIAVSGLIFFYLAFYYFTDLKYVDYLLKSLAYLILFPALLVIFILFFKETGSNLISTFYPRYENFVFLFDLSRGRILSVIDLEFFVPFIFYLFIVNKKIFPKIASLIIFLLTSAAVFLTNYRYRFVSYFIGCLGVFLLMRNQRKILTKIFVTASIFVFTFYTLISFQLGRVNLIGRFLLEDYSNDIDSLRRRWVMIQQGWDLFTQFPIFGVGTGNYKDNVTVVYERFGGRTYEPFYKILQQVYTYPHNWFLLVLTENGVVGFIILLWLLYTFAKTDIYLYRKLKGKSFYIFVTLAIVSWLYVIANNFTMLHHSLPMVIFFWAFRGIIERMRFNYK